MNEFFDTITPMLAAIILVFFTRWVLTLLWKAITAIERHNLDMEQRRIEIEHMRISKEADHKLISLSSHAMPISRQLVESGAIAPQQLRLMLEEIISRRLPDNVPHSLRIDYRAAAEGNAAPVARSSIATTAAPYAPETNASPPTFWELWQNNQLPIRSFLMGYNLDDGKPITATWRQLYSALIGGQSGSGKSTLIRCVLAQAALQGGKFVVIDPHHGAGEESLGASLLPLRHLMLCDVAATPTDMASTIHYMHEIGRRRINGDGDRTPLILVVDETTALLSRGAVADDLIDLLAEIAQEMRKVAVFALCIGQQFKADIIDSAVRNSFVSMISCRARREVARIMSGSNEFGKLAESLVPGQAVWMTPTGETIRLAVPNTTQQHIVAVAQHLTTPNHAAKQQENQNPVAMTPQDAHAIELFRNGAPLKDIMAEAYHVSSGAPYTTSVQHFLSLIRSRLHDAPHQQGH